MPCIRLTDLTKTEKKGLAVADNKLGDLSTFDPERLSQWLMELEDMSFDMELTGFDTAKIDLIIGTDMAATAGASTDPADEVPDADLSRAPVTQAGDVWLLGKHRILCGDALMTSSLDTLLAGELADLVVTDMPYNVSIPNHASELGKARHGEFAMASGEMSRDQFTAFGHLAPDIVTTILAGFQPAALTPRRLFDAELPIAWNDQKAMLGIA